MDAEAQTDLLGANVAISNSSMQQTESLFTGKVDISAAVQAKNLVSPSLTILGGGTSTGAAPDPLLSNAAFQIALLDNRVVPEVDPTPDDGVAAVTTDKSE
jgi:hypothetical protein